MKHLIIALLSVLALLTACQKNEDDLQPSFSIQGYWKVTGDTLFTSTASNASADLYHLFREPNAFYRFSFPKTFDFTALTGKPRSDSLISYYQVKGSQLQIPNPTQNTTNGISGNNLISQSNDQLVFTRDNILSRDVNTGEPLKSRTDTITYVRVKDPAVIAWFDNYLKQWHK